MVSKGDRGLGPQNIYGFAMRRVMIIVAAGIALSGCASFSDNFASAPTPITVPFDSQPQGAEARTSLGTSCTTPCTMPIAAETGFSVTYTLDKYQPATVAVQVTKTPGDLLTASVTTIDPNPVVAELQPLKPPAKTRRKAARKPRAAAAPAAPAAEEAATTPFPEPAR